VYPDAYQLWLVEDDGYLPETDFTVDKSMSIIDLGVDALAFCVNSSFSPPEDNSQNSILD
jgi:hypothetical protein